MKGDSSTPSTQGGPQRWHQQAALLRDVSRLQESTMGLGSTPRRDPHRGSIWELYEEARA